MEFIQESLHTLEDVFIPLLSSLQTEALVAIGAVSLLVLARELATHGTLLPFTINLFAVIVWCVLRGASKGSHVCLLGLSDSGKTLLHQRVSGWLDVDTVILFLVFLSAVEERLFFAYSKLHQGECRYVRSFE